MTTSNVPMRQSDRGTGAALDRRRSGAGLFGDLFGLDAMRSFFPGFAHAPDAFGVEVSQDDDGYTVEIPVPGFSPEQIEVLFQNDTLMVSGKGDRRSFTRSLVLPDEIDADAISANVDHGMLHLHMRRRPETQPRRIAVQSSAQDSTEGAPRQPTAPPVSGAKTVTSA